MRYAPDDLIPALQWLLATNEERHPRGDKIAWRVYELVDAIAEYRTAWAARLNSDTSTAYMERMHAKADALLAMCREDAPPRTTT